MKSEFLCNKTINSLLVLFVLILVFSFTNIQPVSAVDYNVCPGCTYTTIQSAINAASDGDTIYISGDVYSENITISKRVRIIGAGPSTVITQTAAGAGDARIGVVQLTASGTAVFPILLQDLRIEPVGMAGISVGRFTEATGTTVAYIILDNVQVIGTNTSPSTEQERGLYVDLTSSLEHLTIRDSAFNNLTYGWYLQKQVSADASNVRYVDVSNTSFNHNNHKGIYAEKLSDAVFSNCTADQNGYDSSILPSYFQAWSAGFDINLKAGSYANLRFENCKITNNAIDEAKEGVGLTVKARDDGGYSSFPASVDNVAIISGNYTNNERGIRIGEPGKNNASPTNVMIQNASIYNNTQHYSGSDGTAYGDLINMTGGSNWVDAENNWWGDAAGPYDPAGTVEVPPCTSSPATELNADGVGAGVDDRVDYCPWLGAAAVPPVVNSSDPANGTTLAVGPSQITLEFNKDLKNDGSAGAVNNPANYILAEAKGNGFQTIDCAGGLDAGDASYPVNAISFTNNGGVGPYKTVLTVNGGTALPSGGYRLYVCGTTSVEDLFGVKLNNGFDTTVDFSVSTATAAGTSLPSTGFPRGLVSAIGAQPSEKAYTETDLLLEIPSIDVRMPIVGVPQNEGEWDVTWLWENAGWLHGSAFPTWEGNTILTGHVWDVNNDPGPFSEIKQLHFGDQILIRAWGQIYIYEVQDSQLVFPRNVSKVFQHEKYDWVTLLTCEFYNPFNGGYFMRRMVRAVLVEIQ
jgi:LPXTG-site transpeptidase (sortase) family protein